METERKLKLKPETTKRLTELDNSIVFWSVQLGQRMMRLREAEAQIDGLYEFKKTAVLEDLKAQSVDFENCDVTTVDAETVSIVVRLSQDGPPVPPPFEKPGE